MQNPWMLVISHEFPPLGGGAGRNLLLLCQELGRRGVRIRVWTGEPGLRKRQNHPFEIEYFPLGRRKRFETSFSGMLLFIAAILLRSFTGRMPSPPALVLSSLGIPAGVAGALVCCRYRASHAVWYHGSDVHAGRPEGPGAFQRLLLRWIAGSAARNFYISPGLQAMAQAFGAAPKARVLPSCVSPEFRALPRGGNAVPERKYFLFLGRLEPVKNPMLLIDAARIWKARDAHGRGAAAGKVRMVCVCVLSGWCRHAGKGRLIWPFNARIQLPDVRER